MNQSFVRYLSIASVLMGASGCQVVGDIFKAGLWVGVVVVGLVVALIFGLTRAFSAKT